MKHIPFRLLPALAWLLLLTLAAGCKKKESTVSFEVVDSTLMNSVTLSAPPDVQYLPTRRIDSKIGEASTSNTSSTDRVQTATLSHAELSIEGGAPGQNFDFLRLVTVYLLDEQGVSRSILAQSATVPPGATRLTLTPTSQSVVEQLKAGTYLIKPAVEMQPGTQVVVNLKLQLRYQVQARKR
ncbi:hypothetical protein [Hymenobacter sp. B81]|uniref:hypothetical protein n=1 Tax=Hymenobacter sp. B81 TaxID=3344878 RepID=UPI0037DCBF93